MSARPRCRSLPIVSLLVALVMNLINAFEPMTVDDVCHHYYSRQVVRDPLHPFNFETLWHQKPVPAWDVMVAPVHSYYLAPAVAWFPESTVAWRLWLLPLHWLFCFSLLVLLRRFARGHEVPLMAMVVLGPSVLPGVNLFLEVPMLAFGLAGFATLLRSFDRRHLGLAVVSGCLLGLAFQTKYSAMGLVGPWVLMGLVRRRPREVEVSVLAAAVVAGTIEGLVALSHGGGSYFMRQLEITQLRDWAHIVRGMFSHVGVLGAPAAMLALIGLGAPRWLRGFVLAIYIAGHVLVIAKPECDGKTLADGALDSVAYLLMSLCTWGVAAAMLWRLLASALPAWRAGRLGRSARMRLFLVAWFGSELCSSLIVSPFPAARRVLMMVMSLTFAAGWLVARRRGHVAGVRAVAIVTILVGFCYEGIDYLEGRACITAARKAKAFTEATDPKAKLYYSRGLGFAGSLVQSPLSERFKAKVYYTGGWGFEFYAPRNGMEPVLRGRTRLVKGDFIVIGGIDGSIKGGEVPWFECDSKIENKIEKLYDANGDDSIPGSLLLGYYSGRRPIDGQCGPRYVAEVYRAVTSFHVNELVERPNPYVR